MHLDGISFRSLAQEYKLSLGNVYQKVTGYLSQLPHCADISRTYCSRFDGSLEVDDKYVRVKGYERKIPVVYGIDYTTHDIPTYILAEAENYQVCTTFFSSLKLLNYPLRALICDENINIIEACKYVYPNAVVQLCQNHYKENIRRSLDLQTNQHYQSFMHQIEDLLAFKRSPDDFNRKAKNIFNLYKEDQLCLSILVDIHKSQEFLLGWRGSQHVPITTNLIESFNSHLQGRLKTIKGFESFRHADLWLNAYFIRRRLRKFTGCQGKFRNLNGHTSLEKTKKSNVDLPTFFD